jgi:plasmid stability protein
MAMADGAIDTQDRKLIKLDAGTHYRLKVEAARRGVTMIDLAGELLDAGLPSEPPASRRKRPRERDAISA